MVGFGSVRGLKGGDCVEEFLDSYCQNCRVLFGDYLKEGLGERQFKNGMLRYFYGLDIF